MKKRKTPQFILTRQKLLDLLKTVYLGSTMANSFRGGEKNRSHYADIEQWIYKTAKNSGFEEYVYLHEDCGNLHLSAKFFEDTGTERVRIDYDEDVFWDELIHRLAQRDMEEAYGVETVRAMSQEEFTDREQPYLEKWAVEMERYGVTRLSLTIREFARPRRRSQAD